MSENVPLKSVIEHLAELAKYSQQITGGVDERRAVIDRYFAVAPECLETTLPIQQVNVSGHTGYWIIPEGHSGERRLLYIHGGSWMSGSIKAYRAFVEKLAIASNCALLFVDYPLIPENPYPAGLNACVDVYQWLRENGPHGAGSAKQIYIAGDSAGGHLSLCTLIACKDRNIPMPDRVVTISPCVDFTFSGDSIRTKAEVDPIISPVAMPLIRAAYLQNGEDIKNPTISPLYADLSGLPPLMLQTGEAEILLDDSTRFAKAAEVAGVDVTLDLWPDMPHVFQGFAPFLPEAEQAIAKMGAFLQSH